MFPSQKHFNVRHRGWWLFFAGLALAYLLIAHRAHLTGLSQWLPFVILLACPLMHVFGHQSHSGRHHKLAKPDPRSPR